MDEPEDKGYTIKDRRYAQMSEEEKTQARAEEQAQEQTAAAAGSEAAQDSDIPLPGVTFSSFILSLSSSVFISMGAMPDPTTGKVEKNLQRAKQTIDLLGMLWDKTKGNLTADEENLFDHLLYDLRMAYIKEAS
jgi:hypothetical protein